MSDTKTWDWSQFWSVIKERTNDPHDTLVTGAMTKIFNKDFTRWFSSLHYSVQAEVLENAPLDIIHALLPMLAP